MFKNKKDTKVLPAPFERDLNPLTEYFVPQLVKVTYFKLTKPELNERQNNVVIINVLLWYLIIILTYYERSRGLFWLTLR